MTAFARFEADGHPFDDFDLVDTESGTSLVVHDHESPVRMMMAESRGEAYRSFRTLAEAREAPVGAVILEGDDGGQIFATCPAGLARCSDDRLHRLAAELETRLNATSDESPARVVFEPIPIGGALPAAWAAGRDRWGMGPRGGTAGCRVGA